MEAVKVIVRCRPFSEREAAAGYKKVLQIDTTRATVELLPNATPTKPEKAEAIDKTPRLFTYDGSFDEQTSQETVYAATASRIVESVLYGFNGTILAYGQTGTGKTFSMQGIRDDPVLKGIIPRTFQQIFTHIAQTPERQFLVRCSYLEIYNEDVRDLLAATKSGKAPPAKLEIKENEQSGVYVKDLTSFVVKSVEEMDVLMNKGNDHRQVGATLMNAQSSRSHSIFTITVEAATKLGSDNEHITMGKLHLVDLAGSERQSKTGATGDRLKEATKINLSLSALGNCISALVDGKSSHIPYRDSKLTRLLQDSLGGNSKTLMIATLSPADYNYDETLSTLRYAARTKSIKNKPKINEDPKDAMLKQYQDEIEKLKEMLQKRQSGGTSPSKRPGTKAVRGKSSRKESNELLDADTELRDVAHVLEQPDDEALLAMEKQIMAEQAALSASAALAQSEKEVAAKALEARLAQVNQEKESRQSLEAKLTALQDKLLQGGVPIEERFAQQQQELEAKTRLLEEQHKEALALQAALTSHQSTSSTLGAQHQSLQAQVDAVTRELKEVHAQYRLNKADLTNIGEDARLERENVYDETRLVSREVELRKLMLQHFVAPDELESIAARTSFSADLNAWQLDPIQWDTHALDHSGDPSNLFYRPISAFAKRRIAQGDHLMRWRPENILSLPLYAPEKRLQSL